MKLWDLVHRKETRIRMNWNIDKNLKMAEKLSVSSKNKRILGRIWIKLETEPRLYNQLLKYQINSPIMC